MGSGSSHAATKFLWAAHEGSHGRCEEILTKAASAEKKRVLLFAKTEAGNTALMLAAASGHKRIAHLLLSQDVLTSAETCTMLLQQNNQGDTALIMAATNGRKEVVRRLLSKEILTSDKRGEMLVVQSNEGGSALGYAALHGHESIARLLLSHARGGEERSQMCSLRNKYGATALHLAADSGREGAVCALLENVDATEINRMLQLKDNNGKTASDIAKEQGKDAIAKLLSEGELMKRNDEEKGPEEEAEVGAEEQLQLKNDSDEEGPEEEAEVGAEEQLQLKNDGNEEDPAQEAKAPMTFLRAEKRFGIEIANVLSGTHKFFPEGFVPTQGAAECLKKLSFKGSETVVHDALAASTMDPETPPGDTMVIRAFTLESELYSLVTTTMRRTDELGHWMNYVYHLEKALSRRPKFQGTAYRGIRILVPGSLYKPGTTVTWQSFSSATRQVFCVLDFLQNNGSLTNLFGTVFVIKSQTARCVQSISAVPKEEEVIFSSNTHFLVKDMVCEEARKRATLPQLEEYNLKDLKIFLLQELVEP